MRDFFLVSALNSQTYPKNSSPYPIRSQCILFLPPVSRETVYWERMGYAAKHVTFANLLKIFRIQVFKTTTLSKMIRYRMQVVFISVGKNHSDTFRMIKTMSRIFAIRSLQLLFT